MELFTSAWPLQSSAKILSYLQWKSARCCVPNLALCWDSMAGGSKLAGMSVGLPLVLLVVRPTVLDLTFQEAPNFIPQHTNTSQTGHTISCTSAKISRPAAIPSEKSLSSGSAAQVKGKATQHTPSCMIHTPFSHHLQIRSAVWRWVNGIRLSSYIMDTWILQLNICGHQVKRENLIVVITGNVCEKLQSNHHHQHTNTHFYRQMPFMSPNQ